MLCVCVLCCSLTTLTCVDVLDFRFAGTTNTTPPSYCFLRGGSFAPWLRCEHRCFSLMIFMGSILLSTRPAILNKTVRIKFQQNPNNFNDRSKQVQDSSTQLPGINNNIKFHRMFRLAESRTILVKLHRHRPQIEKVGTDGSQRGNQRLPWQGTAGSQTLKLTVPNLGTRGYHCKELPVPRS